MGAIIGAVVGVVVGCALVVRIACVFEAGEAKGCSGGA
jgi:hypothetical protein